MKKQFRLLTLILSIISTTAIFAKTTTLTKTIEASTYADYFDEVECYYFDKQSKINAKKADERKGVLKDNFLCDETWSLTEYFGYSSLSDALKESDTFKKEQVENQTSQDFEK